MKRMRHLLSLGVGLALCTVLAVSASAEEYDIGQGPVQIHHASDGQMVTYQGQTHLDEAPVITGKSTEHTVEVIAPAGVRLHLSIRDLNVDVSAHAEAPALAVKGEGSAVLTLLGNSTVKSGLMHAGVEVKGAALYILGDKSGILNAVGGQYGAGIGGGANADGSKITIAGGNVNATGGVFGAGIGGGQFGDGAAISVLGGQVSVKGGMQAAGIGGGWCGSARDISLLGGSLNAYGVQAVGSGEGGADAVRMDVIPVAGSMQVSGDSGALFTADVGEKVPLNVQSALLITDGFDAEDYVPAAAEEAPTAEAKLAETVPEETAPEETVPAVTEAEAPASDPVPEETKAEEAPAAAKPVSDTFVLKDAEGNTHPFTAERKDNALDIVCEEKGVDLHVTAADLQKLKDEGVYMLRLNFGGQKARVTLQSVLKWLDADTTDAFVRLQSGGGASLIKNGTSFWIY